MVGSMAIISAVAVPATLAAIPSVVDLIQSPDQATLVGNIVKMGAAFLAPVWTEILQRNPGATPNKIDPGLAISMAQTAAMKSSVVHGLWKELLRTALDPERPLTVTKDDVDLLNSMEPFQALLVDILYRHGDQISREAINSPYFIGLIQSDRERLPSPATFRIISETMKLEHGSAPVIDLCDFGYLVQSRTEIGREQMRVPLFTCGGYQMGKTVVYGASGINLIASDGFPKINVDTVLSIGLTYPAVRLATKMSQHRT